MLGGREARRSWVVGGGESKGVAGMGACAWVCGDELSAEVVEVGADCNCGVRGGCEEEVDWICA